MKPLEAEKFPLIFRMKNSNFFANDFNKNPIFEIDISISITNYYCSHELDFKVFYESKKLEDFIIEGETFKKFKLQPLVLILFFKKRKRII